jgi:hypothetical protein
MIKSPQTKATTNDVHRPLDRPIMGSALVVNGQTD